MPFLTLAPLKAVARRTLTTVGVEPRDVKAMISSPRIIHGGAQIRRKSWPVHRIVGAAEKRAALRVLNREQRCGGALIYGGPEDAAYCRAFSEYLGGGYTQAVNSGTNAIYVALRSLDLEPGGEIVVPPITDPGGCMPVPLINCVPVPADSEPGSYNVGRQQIEDVLSDSTRAIIVAHIGGQPVDMDPILELARARNLPVVEDCAQAHGARYKGRLVGTLGDVAAFSTMYGKHHATGAQGGVVFTRDRDTYTRVRQVTDRGKPFGMLGKPGNVVASLNFNQDALSMAMGLVQLSRLPQQTAQRRQFVQQIAAETNGLSNLRVVMDAPHTQSSYWFVLVDLDLEQLKCGLAEFAQAMREEGIGGVYAGYPFFPTDQPWHTDRVLHGISGEPWTNPRQPQAAGHRQRSVFPLTNARAADMHHVRIDIHGSLGHREARDIAAVLRKLSEYFAK